MKIENLTTEEFEMLNEMLINKRKEDKRRELVDFHRDYLEQVVISTIDTIGLEDTKVIIRDINRRLRSLNE
jgi:hypothetical protein